MKIILPEGVSYIIHKLEENGYEAYAVGGCIRDTILGRIPEDWDITTSAKPQEIKECFKRTVDTGIKHGTVTVMLNHIGYEVTTYRIDGVYEDGRHPKDVEFTGNLLLDLERRDFTINAMAYNEKAGLIDEFGGIQDISDKVIRCVGDAGKRFDEDALRMLRAVRFSGQLSFRIEEETRNAIIRHVEKLSLISAERIRVELSKLIISKNSGQIYEIYNTGMSRIFLPELDAMMKVRQHNNHHIYTVGEHCIHSVGVMNLFFGIGSDCIDNSNIPKDVFVRASDIAKDIDKKGHLILCFTMLLHDIAKPQTMTVDDMGTGHFYEHPVRGEKIADNILKRLTFDNDTIAKVKRLIRFHDYRLEGRKRILRRAISKIGSDIMPMLFLVQYADILSQNPDTFEEKFEKLNAAYEGYEQVINDESPLSLKDLAVNGRDIIEFGIKPGPAVGETLKLLLDTVLEEPEKNDRETLLNMLKGRF